MPQASFNPPWFVRKDLDGFFGLMIDNLIQLILIVSFCRELIHMPDEYIFGRILPGAAISILVGNFFYAWQARPPAKRTQSDQRLAVEIAAVHAESRRRYGSPRVHAELRDRGQRGA